MQRFAVRWDSLAMNMQGALMLPGAPHYETARHVWNAMTDRHPAAIAACASRADVVAAVRFAAEAGLKVTVRGGGHSVGGLASHGLNKDTMPVGAKLTVDGHPPKASGSGGVKGVLVFSFTFADGKKVVLGDEAAAFGVPRGN